MRRYLIHAAESLGLAAALALPLAGCGGGEPAIDEGIDLDDSPAVSAPGEPAPAEAIPPADAPAPDPE